MKGATKIPMTARHSRVATSRARSRLSSAGWIRVLTWFSRPTNMNLPMRISPIPGGRPVLVTQAYAYGVAYADVNLSIDPAGDEVTEKSAIIVPVYADRPPGTTPDPVAETLLENVGAAVNTLTTQVIATSAENITRAQNPAGESTLGNLVADSERAATGADIALVTTG